MRLFIVEYTEASYFVFETRTSVKDLHNSGRLFHSIVLPIYAVQIHCLAPTTSLQDQEICSGMYSAYRYYVRQNVIWNVIHIHVHQEKKIPSMNKA